MSVFQIEVSTDYEELSKLIDIQRPSSIDDSYWVTEDNEIFLNDIERVN